MRYKKAVGIILGVFAVVFAMANIEAGTSNSPASSAQVNLVMMGVSAILLNSERDK